MSTTTNQGCVEIMLKRSDSNAVLVACQARSKKVTVRQPVQTDPSYPQEVQDAQPRSTALACSPVEQDFEAALKGSYTKFSNRLAAQSRVRQTDETV